ncbi:(4Fe-4S)-binding protein [Frankia sp. AiPs1]|uniref:ferredoxin n=1 Tax=Frankia sp. AiPs1 TaxID=573493 RepID=UPI0020439AEE|nr:ferredoxin [Frankia sp. AiPs1]MCM3923141.1 (4Fe-4S)-binding protein [Frankia sp. AiPs1]
MRIVAERDRCIGAGNCVMTAPEVFDQDDDGLVAPLVDEADPVDPASLAAARRAVERCPATALRAVED